MGRTTTRSTGRPAGIAAGLLALALAAPALAQDDGSALPPPDPFAPVAQVSADRTPPVVTGVALRPPVVPSVRRGAGGGVLVWEQSETGPAVIIIQRLRPGRIAGGRCILGAGRPGVRPCVITNEVRRLSVTGVAGRNRARIAVRVNGRKLAIGTHRVRLLVTDSAGNTAPAVSRGLRVVAPLVRPS